jgi:hypothetical protein
MITTNVERFIELQTTINNQIHQHGEADEQLAGELEMLGDQFTNDEISTLTNLMENDAVEEMEYEDAEWMIA